MSCEVIDDLDAAEVAPDIDIDAGANGVLEPDSVVNPDTAIRSTGRVSPVLGVDPRCFLTLLDG